MRKTKDLYGMSAKEVHQEIAWALNRNADVLEFGDIVHEIMCNVRIDLLKQNLAKVAEKDITNQLCKEIADAIDFWVALRDE